MFIDNLHDATAHSFYKFYVLISVSVIFVQSLAIICMLIVATHMVNIVTINITCDFI